MEGAEVGEVIIRPSSKVCSALDGLLRGSIEPDPVNVASIH